MPDDVHGRCANVPCEGCLVQAWPSVLRRVAGRHQLIAAALMDATPSLAGRDLVLTFQAGSEFARNMVDTPQTTDLVLDAIEEELGWARATLRNVLMRPAPAARRYPMSDLKFDRWTERARHALVLAQEEARALRHPVVTTGHMLLGLVREEDGVAARALADIGFSADLAKGILVGAIEAAQGDLPDQLIFSERAKKVCELALREALSLGHNYIGTEHVLLALAREFEGIHARAFTEHGTSADTIRSAVMRVLVPPPVSVSLSRAQLRWLVALVGTQPLTDRRAVQIHAALVEALGVRRGPSASGNERA